MDELASESGPDRHVLDGQQPRRPESGPKPDIENAEGPVKWFDPRKGFGFITGPEGQDIFAHFSTIEGDGFRVLKDGSRVTYDAIKTDKGWKALRVRRVEEAEVVVTLRRQYTRTPRR